jgi:hypothetical protein
MKKEIWVECVNGYDSGNALTKGKQYLATIEDGFTYTVKNDKGENDWFSKHRFKSVDKTSILKTIKWNGVDDIDMEVDDIYRIIVKCENKFIKFMLYDDTQLDLYTFKLINNPLAVDKLNDYMSKFNIKLELEQP